LPELGLAFVLSALIDLEPEIRQKSAGSRTYPLVGFSSALSVVVDPSRIVSGAGCQIDDESPAAGDAASAAIKPRSQEGTVTFALELRGGRSIAKLIGELMEINGVVDVQGGEVAGAD
jgi:MgtC family